MKERFRFLDIATADMAFEAFGKTLEQAFANAMIALEEIITDTDKIKEKIEKNIELEAENENALLFDFLSELLFIFDTEQLIFKKADIKIKKNKKLKLKAKLTGDYFGNKEVRGDVKAITYHRMKVEKKDNMWVVRVIVDT